MKSRCNKIFSAALLAMSLAVVGAGCSDSSSNRGDVPVAGGASQASVMSPEACMANGASFENASLDTSGYRIQPGDQLAIDFYLNSEFNDNVSVQPDGRIVLRL